MRIEKTNNININKYNPYWSLVKNQSQIKQQTKTNAVSFKNWGQEHIVKFDKLQNKTNAVSFKNWGGDCFVKFDEAEPKKADKSQNTGFFSALKAKFQGSKFDKFVDTAIENEDKIKNGLYLLG